MGVYIEIRDTDNSIVGRLDVGNSDEFPLVLNREISDYSVLNKRGGLYSLDFDIPYSESNASLFPNIYNANLKDVKQFFKRKKAIIYNNDIYIDEGYIQVLSIKNIENVFYLKCIFYGDNLAWATSLDELKLNEVNFADSTFDFTYNEIINSWSNNADNNDFVFPYIEYGQINRYTVNATRVEEYRPALFIKRILTTAFNQVGYNLSSSFFDTSSFKGLVLPYFSDSEEDRWVNTDDVLNTYYLSTLTNLNTNLTLLATQNYYNNTTSVNYKCEADRYSRVIPLEVEGGNNTAVYNNSTYVYSGFTQFGYYTFDYNIVCTIKTAATNSDGELRFCAYNTRTGVKIIKSTSIGSPQPMVGQVSLDIQSGDQLYFYLDYYVYSRNDITSPTNSCTVNRPLVTITIGSNTSIRSTISKSITYGKNIALADVLSRSYTILELINDLSRLFNLFWKTNNATKTVYVEPRDDFFNGITSSIDITDKIAIDKGYNLTDLKSILPRYYSFNYQDDNNDGITTYFNNRYKKAGVSKLGSYKDYDLGNGYDDSEEVNETLRCSYCIVKGMKFVYQFAYTATIWSGNTIEPTNFSTVCNPRILNYVYGEQSLQYANEAFQGSFVNNTLLRIVNPSTSYASATYGEKFKTFGFCLNQSLYDTNGGLISSAPINLDYKDSRDGQVGLLNTYYKGTINTLKNGKSLEIYINFNPTFFKNIDLFSPVYISSPEEIQGYWYIESIKGFKVSEENQLVSCRLIQYKNIEALTQTNEDITNEIREIFDIKAAEVHLPRNFPNLTSNLTL